MANVRIPQLPLAIGIDGNEEIEIAQPDGFGGYVSRRTTLGATQSASEIGAAPVVLTEPYGFAANGRVLAGTTGNISVTDGGPGLDITLDLIASGVVAATYGDSTHVPQITVDDFGRITSASEIAIATNVTSVSVVTANGFAGNVANPTTAPDITLSTTVTGILQGNGTAISAASTTGTGNVVLSTSPVLVTPDLGTPSAVVLTNGTGLPVSTGIAGLGTGVATFLATPSSANLAAAVTDETGSGALVFATSPVLVTPNLGTPSAAVLTNAIGLPVASGISGLGAGVATFLATPSSANLATAVTDETGSGALVFATSPALVTPTIGVATATSINKVAITAPASAATLTIANNKTLTVSNSLTLAGTDSTTMTFPATSSTVLTTGNTATITKGFTVTPNSLGNMTNFTIDPSLGNYQYGTNHGAVTITAPASDCAVDLLVTNDASAGSITFSGFTVGSATGSPLTTTNTNKFIISIRRINAVSTYSIYALQ